MNTVSLIGRITHDLELRETQSGAKVINFQIAVDRETKEKKTDFIRVEAWGQSADFLHSYAGKGTSIGVIGQLRVDTYETEKGKQEKVFVRADRIEICSQPKTREHSVEDSNKSFADSVYGTPYADKFGGSMSNFVEEKDLPFY